MSDDPHPADGSGSNDGAPGDVPGDDQGGDGEGGIGRRELLVAGGAVAGLGATGYLGWSVLSGGNSAPGEWSEDDDVDRSLVERYAPRLEFGRYEQWYPTDPRRYVEGVGAGSGASGDSGTPGDGSTTSADGAGDGGDGVAVDGFRALDGYTREFRERGAPPAPTVFYRTLSEQSSPLVTIQYWMYSVFDQFAVNFHWHDWELFQVFVDTDADEAVLLSASAHSRKVPNNEHIDPGGGLGLLSEVGAHASALDVDGSGTFRRTAGGDLAADITNGLVDFLDRIGEFPFAYGLPRDEGGPIPYSIPELDGAPLWEHPDLPNVRQADLIGDPLVVRKETNLLTAPADVPTREPGLTLALSGSSAAGDADETYELAPMSGIRSTLSDFSGPQLSFEFAVPKAVEDQFASHLSTVGLPWGGKRYTDPLADVSDDGHRREIANRYDLATGEGAGGTAAGTTADGTTGGAGGRLPAALAPGSLGSTADALGGLLGSQQAGSDRSKLLAAVEGTTTGTEGRLRGAPDAAKEELAPEVGFTLTDPPVEAGALLETADGDTVATVTAGGALMLDEVDPGEHRLVVDGAGQAPHSERVAVGESDGPARAGAGGNLPLVPREDAVKVGIEPGSGDAAVSAISVTEDYAGGVFDAPASEGDAVYVHGAGTYTVDVLDDDGDPGAARVDPDPEGDGEGGIALPAETGKAAMAEYLERYLRESAELTREYREGDPTEDDGGDSDGETTTTTSPGQGGGNAGGGGGTTGGGTTSGGSEGGGGPGQGTTRSVAQFFEAAAGAADRAAGAAREGNLQSADAQLESVRERLTGLRSRIDAQRGNTLSETLATVLSTRVEGTDRRAEAAIESSK